MINKDFENCLQLINKLIAELSTRIVLPFEGKDLILITHSHNSKTTYAYPISESYDVNIKLPSKIYKEETNSKQGKSVKSKNFDSTILCTNYVIREVDVVLQGINVNYFIPDSDLINNDDTKICSCPKIGNKRSICFRHVCREICKKIEEQLSNSIYEISK